MTVRQAWLIRFVLYFTLGLGWLWLYYERPELRSNTPFVYQEF